MPGIKKMQPVQATQILFYSPNRPAQILYKAIRCALANAKQTLKVGDDLLQFKTFTVEEGQKLKRYRPGGRGVMHGIRKRYSHIKIILTAKESTVKPMVSKSEIIVSSPKVKSQTAKKAASVSK